MSEEENTNDMVNVSLASDDKDKQNDGVTKKTNKDDDKTKTRSTSSSTRGTRLLPASIYATVMGRHLIDWGNDGDADEESVIKFEWPGVRFSFTVTNTTSVAIRLQTAGSVFGYRVVPMSDAKQEQAVVEAAAAASAGNNSSPGHACHNEEKVLGGGLFGRGMKNHSLATDLDPATTHQVQIWKRNDPMGVCQLQGLVVDENATGIKPKFSKKKKSKRKSDDSDSSNNTPLHLEFVGSSDTVGFGNLAPKSSLFYFVACQMACLPISPSLYQGTDVTKAWPAFLCQALQEANNSNNHSRDGGDDDNVDNDGDGATMRRHRFDDVQYSVIAWSGIGAKYSIGMEETMIDVYPRILPSDDQSIMKQHKNDDDNDDARVPQPPVNAVLVYLGQNDASSLQETFAYSESKLTSAFEILIKMIRHRRKFPIPIIIIAPSLDAAVACATSEKERHKTCESQNRLWKALVEEKLGGERDGFYFIENQHEPAIDLNSEDDFGMGLHWNAASQRKWARALEPKVRDILLKQPQPNTDNNKSNKRSSKDKRKIAKV